MSDYLFLVNVGDGIVNSVQLSRFVPNRRSGSRQIIDYFKSINLHEIF